MGLKALTGTGMQADDPEGRASRSSEWLGPGGSKRQAPAPECRADIFGRRGCVFTVCSLKSRKASEAIRSGKPPFTLISLSFHLLAMPGITGVSAAIRFDIQICPMPQDDVGVNP